MCRPSKMLTIFLFFLILIACNKEEEATINQLYVDPELEHFFESFVEEAAARGLAIDLEEEQIEGYIRNIPDRDVIGQCAYSPASPRQVTIDEPYWNRANFTEKEIVVFHELGHCLLERGHRDEADSLGNCISIMHSGLGDCELDFRNSTREAYLDELFNN